MTEINQAFINAVRDELARIRLREPRTMDEAEAAALFPDAWRKIQEQVADVQQCSGGATFMFIAAQVHRNELRVLYAHDMTTIEGLSQSTMYTAEIERMN
jgi:hypothetical protein